MNRQQLRETLEVYKEDGLVAPDFKLSAPTDKLQAEYDRVRAKVAEDSAKRYNMTRKEMKAEIATSLKRYLDERFGSEQEREAKIWEGVVNHYTKNGCLP